jgi:molecular chaperone DnaK (HSP70)
MFCPGCGLQRFDLRAEPPAATFYVDARNLAPTYDHPIRIADDGQGGPDIVYESGPKWASYLAPGVLRLDTRDGRLGKLPLPLGPEKAIFRAAPSDVTVGIEVAVFPLPEVAIEPLTVSKGFTSGFPAKLSLTVWCPIYVTELQFAPEWLRLREPEKLKSTRLLGECEIPVEVDIPAGVANDATIGYTMRIQGVPEPIAGRLPILLREPPKLVVKLVVQLALKKRRATPELLNGEGLFDLTLVNAAHEADLWVDGISLQPLNNAPPLIFDVDLTRFEIKAGKERIVSISAHPPGGLSVKEGTYFYRVEFQSNDPEAPSKEISLRVTDEDYLGFVALDYGTTDTTAAIFDVNQNTYVNLLLDPPLEDPKIYSNIFFQAYAPEKSPRFVWKIGSIARSFRHTREARQRLVQAIKVRLGLQYRRRILFAEMREEVAPPAEEIAKYILTDLLKRIRLALGKHPLHFVLCVPTRFTLRRRQALCDTFQAAARDARVDVDSLEVVDESLAAGIYSLTLERKNKPDGNPAIAMTVDFGGGTTDVTLMRVEWRDRNTLASVEIVGAWGDPNMGGEEITFQIAKLLLSQYLQRPIDDTRDEELCRALIPQAESIKLAVSEIERAASGGNSLDPGNVLKSLSPAAIEEIDNISRHYAIADENERRRRVLESYFQRRTIELQHAEFDRHIEIAPEAIAEIFRQKIDSLHEALTSLLQGLGLKQVDILLLAGQSSRFPLVEDKLRDLADKLEYVVDDAGKLVLKECVSRGALILAGAGRKIAIGGRDKIWTTLGYYNESEFEELVKWGSSPSKADQGILFQLGHEKVSRGVLKFELREKTNLIGNLTTEVYGVFEVDVRAAAQNDYECRLSIENDGAIEVRCKLGNDWVAMQPATRVAG